CQQLVEGWFRDFCKVSFRVATNGSPHKDQPDASLMTVPLKLTCTLSLGSRSVEQVIPMDAKVEIPRGLAGLPVAIGKSIGLSAASIAQDLLSNPNTYGALSMAIAVKGGASAAARMICQGMKNGMQEAARSIANAAS